MRSHAEPHFLSAKNISDLHRTVDPCAGLCTEARFGARYWEVWLGVREVVDPSVGERSTLRDAEAIRGPHESVGLDDLTSEDHRLSRSQMPRGRSRHS